MKEPTITNGRSSRRTSSAPYWLIASTASEHVDVFIADCGVGGAVLPIFSSGEEALLFVERGLLGAHWRTRPTGIGELVSLLYGPCRRIRSLALDPSWDTLANGTLGLVSLSREAFMDSLLGRDRSWFEKGYRRLISS